MGLYSSNNEVYEHIKKSFDEELAKKEFIEINEKINFNNKGKVKDYKKLDTSITRLHKKFKSLKSECFKLHSRIKYGSGLAPSNEPLLFKHTLCCLTDVARPHLLINFSKF